jgi:hypothetical protein
LDAKTPIASGSHPWYEVHADPESSDSLVVCGTRWDSRKNAFYGFVYASSDAGANWKLVLEDTNSTWVSEHSCAFGSGHRVYFISEASKIVDGEPHHEWGRTRLYVSSDSGQHWVETIKTGWADHSATAVSASSGRVYTFFNIPYTQEMGRHPSSSVGLLVFSRDGKVVAGPFVSSEIHRLGYRGVYPFFAIGLRSGGVICLYHGITPDGRKQDLAIIRAGQSRTPSFENTIIAQSTLGKDCSSFDRGSVAYDSEHNRLIVVYGDGCRSRRLMLTSSNDEGRTWSKALALSVSGGRDGTIVAPSLVAGSAGFLGLLWEDGWFSGRWLFSSIQNQRLVGSPVELASGLKSFEPSTDVLETSIVQARGRRGRDPERPSGPPVILNIFNSATQVWRVAGLVALDQRIVAVWPAVGSDGMKLYSGILSSSKLSPKRQSPSRQELAGETDVTQQIVLEYGGLQEFRSTTSTLDVCLVLGNRTERPLKVPIELEVANLGSPVGALSILNSTNGLTGVGAIWDISDSVTGSQIPPRADSNPFCLSFHIERPPGNALPLDPESLLSLDLRVRAQK